MSTHQRHAGRLADHGEICNRAMRDGIPRAAGATAIKRTLIVIHLALFDFAGDAGDQKIAFESMPARLIASAAAMNAARPPFML